LGPFSESGCSVILHPVSHRLLEQSALLIPIVCGVDPGIEPSSHLHMSGPGNEIGHHFFAQRLHLVDGVLLDILSDQNIILNSLD
jgi:hypothetical protein